MEAYFRGTPVCASRSTFSKFSNVDFWLGGVARTVICSAGMTCNALVILVFSRPHMSHPFNQLLLLLAYFDLSYLFHCLLDGILVTVHSISSGGDPITTNSLWWMLHPLLLHPMQQVFLTGSIYMSVAVSLDRYVAVMRPLSNVSARRDRLLALSSLPMVPLPLRSFCRAHLVALAVLVFSVAYSLPHFFEYTCCDVNANGVIVAVSRGMLDNTTYTLVYTGLVDAFVRTLIPASIMLFTASKIIPVVRESHKEIGGRVDYPLLLTNAALVLLFVASHVCKLVFNGYSSLPREEDDRSDEGACDFLVVLYQVGSILLVLNSSVGLVVYVCVGNKFRATLLRMFGFRLASGRACGAAAAVTPEEKDDCCPRLAVVSVDSKATNRPSVAESQTATCKS